MGSIGEAKMVGFVCRLCSKIKTVVIHLYSARAKKLNLLHKIKLLPISLEKYDDLPKTVCESCIEKLDLQYRLLMRIRHSDMLYKAHERYHTNGNCPIECPMHSNEY
ncbi:uncharacterized protein [Euwallacea similis]|uniref:uncharacterized protein n=1 Tax=Euwallacea similis TaxID=1736056 RepID=UPI00344C7998